jgi:plastocyanin
MPFDQPDPAKGSKSITLKDPGLYVFTCKVHPYMFGIVIVDDPATQGLDL